MGYLAEQFDLLLADMATDERNDVLDVWRTRDDGIAAQVADADAEVDRLIAAAESADGEPPARWEP